MRQGYDRNRDRSEGEGEDRDRSKREGEDRDRGKDWASTPLSLQLITQNIKRKNRVRSISSTYSSGSVDVSTTVYEHLHYFYETSRHRVVKRCTAVL
jgi:hypothetical protein